MKQKSSVLNCRIPEKLKTELQRRADRENISVAAMLRIILTKSLRVTKVN